ncbi:hypothetical protein EUTSA_v10000620mg [Eutrema salsugineum]|uniref:DUF4283 domain-containing protein n=1 Tax=Eutrema salsugineum TaxID=72664 RepID=V4M2T6_EUTSA|nr:hypothetical protein EUTSA_v10000620mg [Eutrema salsugineum]
MAQSNLVKQTGLGMNADKSLKRLKITVPHFDNTNLIESYSRTLIGRCMNPHMQDMKALLFMLPRIWKVEERVAGADLGLGRFQFDFDKEEDIIEIMKMEPVSITGCSRWCHAEHTTAAGESSDKLGSN